MLIHKRYIPTAWVKWIASLGISITGHYKGYYDLRFKVGWGTGIRGVEAVSERSL